MSESMIVAAGFILVSFVLYTVVIFRERHTKKLERWMIQCFFFGFATDMIGSGIMMAKSKHALMSTMHGKLGITALIIMALHLFWAFLTALEENKYQNYFTKYSIYAWLMWVLASFSGIFV